MDTAKKVASIPQVQVRKTKRKLREEEITIRTVDEKKRKGKRRRRRKNVSVDFGKVEKNKTGLETIEKEQWGEYVLLYKSILGLIVQGDDAEEPISHPSATPQHTAIELAKIERLRQERKAKEREELVPLVESARMKGDALDQALRLVREKEQELRSMYEKEEQLRSQLKGPALDSRATQKKTQQLERVGGSGGSSKGSADRLHLLQTKSKENPLMCRLVHSQWGVSTNKKRKRINLSWREPNVVSKTAEQDTLSKLLVPGEYARIQDNDPKLRLLVQPRKNRTGGRSPHQMTVEQMARLHNFHVKGGHLFNMRRDQAKKLVKRFDAGEDILQISKEEQVQPVRVMVAVLGMKRYCHSDIQHAMRNPATLKDAKLRVAMTKAKQQHNTVGVSKEDRQAADTFERALAKFLREKGIRFKKEDAIKQEQRKLFGLAILTPDFLILDELYVNGKRIYWIDAKNIYLCDSENLAKKLKCKTDKYLANFGYGALVCSLGYCENMKQRLPKILILDGSDIRPDGKTTSLSSSKQEEAGNPKKEKLQSLPNGGEDWLQRAHLQLMEEPKKEKKKKKKQKKQNKSKKKSKKKKEKKTKEGK